MKITSRETYKIVRAILQLKRFTQYEISKKENVTFSLVNRTVNWFVEIGYIAKSNGRYELAAPASVISLFPLFRKMKPFAVFDIDLPRETVLGILKGKSILCLTSALSFYDDYYRDPSIYAYAKNDILAEELKDYPKGYAHIELFKEDLNKDDFIKKGGHEITTKTRTVIDLFCSGKGYSAERLIKKEWGKTHEIPVGYEAG